MFYAIHFPCLFWSICSNFNTYEFFFSLLLRLLLLLLFFFCANPFFFSRAFFLCVVSLFSIVFHYINSVSHSYSSMCSNFRTKSKSECCLEKNETWRAWGSPMWCCQRDRKIAEQWITTGYILFQAPTYTSHSYRRERERVSEKKLYSKNKHFVFMGHTFPHPSI